MCGGGKIYLGRRSLRLTLLLYTCCTALYPNMATGGAVFSFLRKLFFLVGVARLVWPTSPLLMFYCNTVLYMNSWRGRRQLDPRPGIIPTPHVHEFYAVKMLSLSIIVYSQRTVLYNCSHSGKSHHEKAHSRCVVQNIQHSGLLLAPERPCEGKVTCLKVSGKRL